MTVETPSLFARVIQDHLELKRRNAELERELPLESYKNEDPFENHPLFKTEEQARIEDTMSGEDAFSIEELERWSEVPEVEERRPEPSLWGRSRDFDWGD